MDIQEWFDPTNEEHMAAYQHLMDESVWPVNFIPEGVVLGGYWQGALVEKMAGCWIEYVLTDVKSKVDIRNEIIDIYATTKEWGDGTRSIVPAVKRYREITGCGLKEAVGYVKEVTPHNL